MQAGLPICYWTCAVTTLCYLIYVEEINGPSAWFRMLGGYFNWEKIPFGALVDFKLGMARSKKREKFEPRDETGVFAEYTPAQDYIGGDNIEHASSCGFSSRLGRWDASPAIRALFLLFSYFCFSLSLALFLLGGLRRPNYAALPYSFSPFYALVLCFFCIYFSHSFCLLFLAFSSFSIFWCSSNTSLSRLRTFCAV